MPGLLALSFERTQEAMERLFIIGCCRRPDASTQAPLSWPLDDGRQHDSWARGYGTTSPASTDAMLSLAMTWASFDKRRSDPIQLEENPFPKRNRAQIPTWGCVRGVPCGLLSQTPNVPPKLQTDGRLCCGTLRWVIPCLHDRTNIELARLAII